MIERIIVDVNETESRVVRSSAGFNPAASGRRILEQQEGATGLTTSVASSSQPLQTQENELVMDQTRIRAFG